MNGSMERPTNPATANAHAAPAAQPGAAARNDNARVVRRALLVCAGAFAFAFSMVPLYRIACEQVFGIKLDADAASVGDVGAMVVDESRLVTVEFDTGVNSRLDWAFRSELASMQVHPGKLYEATFFARNDSPRSIVGQAVPSVAPSTASIYFNKTECFCFTEQLLDAGEERAMPVRFVVDPALPGNISTLTLSYTFYNNEQATARIAAAAATTGATGGS